jgi:hypothetical protein
VTAGEAVWPWLVLAGLGVFHGLNPAMGWLFAVALGLHRGRRADVFLALVPIAVGHLVSVGLLVALFLGSGFIMPPHVLARIAGAGLIAWALYHALWGHRHRVRFGMQTSLAGLAAWSFLMATSHGAGLMLAPALMPLCLPGGASLALPAAAGTAIMAILVHTLAMLATTAAVAALVYEWLGVGVLRSAWINFDLLWTLALAATGTYLLLSG